MIPAII